MKRIVDTIAVDENGFAMSSQNLDCVNVTAPSSSTLSVTLSSILRITSSSVTQYSSSTLTVISSSSSTSNVMPFFTSTPTVMPSSSFTSTVMPLSSFTPTVMPSSNSTSSMVSSPRPPDLMKIVDLNISSSLDPSNDFILPGLELSYDADMSLSSSPRSDEPSFASTPIQLSMPPAVVPPVAIIEEMSSENMASGRLLRPELIRYLCKKSCSRKNFAAKLVEITFDKDTRSRSNVAGKMGKLKLNPVLIEYVQSLEFHHFPLEEGETNDKEWARCVVAFDEKNRRLNKT